MESRKIRVDGEEVDAIEIDFKSEREDWDVYSLEDGNTLRVRHLVVKVLKVTSKAKENGDPIYAINATLMVDTVVRNKE